MPASAKRSAAKKSAAKSPAKTAHKPAAKSALGKLPEWNLADLYAGIDDPRVKRDLDRGDAESHRLREGLQGQARRAGRRTGCRDGARRGGEALRGARRSARPADLLRGPRLRRQHRSIPSARKFYGDVQERITAVSLHLLFFTLELNRLDDAELEAAMADPALGHYRPWLEDIRKDKPYQLEDRIEQLFHEKSVTGLLGLEPAVRRDHRGPALQGRGKELAIEPTLNLMQDTKADTRKAAAEALAKTFKENLRIFALITNTLAKDKEISDRWRGFKRRRGRAPSRQPRRARGGRRAGGGGARRLSAAVAPLLRAEGAMVRQEAAAALGPQRAAAAGRGPHHRLGRGASDRADRLWRVLAEDGVDRRALLRAPLDRRAGAARQGAGRLRAPDRAVGAPLRAAQLPGQAARRDDARARARPRRAPGAGGAERRADGADAADAGRDRERVRRDADLPQAPRQRRDRSSARPCSPPRSRT